MIKVTSVSSLIHKKGEIIMSRIRYKKVKYRRAKRYFPGATKFTLDNDHVDYYYSNETEPPTLSDTLKEIMILFFLFACPFTAVFIYATLNFSFLLMIIMAPISIFLNYYTFIGFKYLKAKIAAKQPEEVLCECGHVYAKDIDIICPHCNNPDAFFTPIEKPDDFADNYFAMQEVFDSGRHEDYNTLCYFYVTKKDDFDENIDYSKTPYVSKNTGRETISYIGCNKMYT